MPSHSHYMTVASHRFRTFPVAGLCASEPLRGWAKSPASLFICALLAGCGGMLYPSGTTHVIYSKNEQGVETVEIHDGKDRASFSASIQSADGSTLTIDSADVNGSTAQAQALAAQQQMLSKLEELVNQLAQKR